MRKLLYIVSLCLALLAMASCSVHKFASSGEVTVLAVCCTQDTAITAPVDSLECVRLLLKGRKLCVEADLRSAGMGDATARMQADTLYIDFATSQADTLWHRTTLRLKGLRMPESGYLPIRFRGKQVLPLIATADTITYPLLDSCWGEGASKSIVGDWQEWKRVVVPCPQQSPAYELCDSMTGLVHSFYADGSWVVRRNEKIERCGVFRQYKTRHWYLVASKRPEIGRYYTEEDVYADPSFTYSREEYLDVYDYAANPAFEPYTNILQIYSSDPAFSKKRYFKATPTLLFFVWGPSSTTHLYKFKRIDH